MNSTGMPSDRSRAEVAGSAVGMSEALIRLLPAQVSTTPR